MENVKVTIDGKTVEVPAGTTILNAAKQAGIDIPTLCYHPDLDTKAMCRICLVEVEGARTLQTACSQPVMAGMVIRTTTPQVREARKINMELILSNHPQDCLNCIRNQKCELQSLTEKMGIRSQRFEQTEKFKSLPDCSSSSIVRDPSKCILCRRCVAVCHKVQQVGAIYPIHRGMETEIAPAWGNELNNVACVSCGQCIQACPVGALHEVDDTAKVWDALANPKLHVIVQTAPAVRVAIGEELGLPAGSKVTGKMVAALRKLGFAKVFDTDFAADLTIIEEGNELLDRLNNHGVLPMITSCSPGWIKYIEYFYPELLGHLSTCKSPQQMFGALAKSYYAEKMQIPASQIFMVAVMPCTAKKFECQRPELSQNGLPDVDVVITTRELGRMLREAGIDFQALPDEAFDEPLGISTGAGVIFGATGGVMEAALRTVYEVVTEKKLPKIDLEEVRGLDGVKEATIDLDGAPIKVAVAHGLGNAKKLMEKIKDGTADYQFIEIMSCPGGCIGGGGQPIPTNAETIQSRLKAIYEEDKGMELRKSHENPAIKQLYEEYLGQPLGEKSHHLLHTHYTERKKY